MMKKLIAILLIAVSISLFCAEKYAVLIAGDYSATNVPRDKKWNNGLGDNSEFWNDLYLQWEMLYQKGYKKENITVIFANGIDHWRINPAIDTRYRAEHATDNPEETITNYSSTKTNLKAAVTALNLKIQPDDFLYVWAMSHGGVLAQSSICLIDPTGASYYDMTDTEFASYFNTVIANKKVFVINANYAGGFLNSLKADNSFVQVSSTDTKSFRADDKIKDGTYIPFLENEEINSRVYYHGEIGYHNFCAAVGLTPSGADNYNGTPLSDAEIEGEFSLGDGLISVLEFSAWTSEYESSTENPGTDNTSRLIGFSSSFLYPTILRNSWNQGEAISNFGLRGICAVPEDIFLEYDDFFDWTRLTFEENSKTTVFKNAGINVGKASSLTFEKNSMITGMENSYIATNGWGSTLHFNDCSFNNISISHYFPLYSYGTLQFNSAQLISSGQIESQSEVTYLNFNNNSLFGIIGGNFKKEIDGEVFVSVDYNPEEEEQRKSLYNLDITIDNSDFMLKNVYVGDPYLLVEKIINNSTVTIENDVIGYVGLDLYSNSKISLGPNSRFAEGGVSLNESTELTIGENGLFAGNLFITDDVKIKLHNNSRLKKSLVLTNNCEVQVQENSKFTIEPGYSLKFNSGSTLRLLNGSELVIPETSVIVFEKGSQIIIEGSAKITGNFGNAYASIIINDNSKLTLGTGSNLTLWYNEANSVTGGINSEVVIESGAVLNFNPTTPCIMGTGSKITVQASGNLYTYENSFSGNPVWNGIIAEVGSNVSLVSSRVKNAQLGLSAIGANVSVNWSSFVDCYNGVSITNCTGYTLNNNYFKGMYSGYDSGISLTECGGSITGNTVTNFGRGVILTLSSVNLIKNKINSNRLSGVYVTGYNVPQMINSSDKIELNNEVKNNGDVQVLLIYHANVYLTGGYNNIYSDPINVVPSIPCIYTAGWQLEPEDQLDGKALLPNIVSIHAERNYWGYSGVISDNFDSFFGVGINTLHQGYSLTYEPYAVDPYTAVPGIPPRLSSNEPPSVESNLLSTALMLEDKGNIKPAIKKYEQILSKYPDSSESYVANARLPELYLRAERDVNELLMAYDEALESDVTTDKKFFKQMKITANTKSAKYDEAISIAEEMKAEAENEAEITLADLSIAIAETMKNNGKSNDRSGTNTICDLLAKLTGKGGEEQEGEPSDITESVLPSQHELFQNYPNPFNPVTQIKFDLAKNAQVKLSVYNISGQKVAELANGVMNAGNHAVDFDGSKLNSGIYYYTLETDGTAITKKMVLMK